MGQWLPFVKKYGLPAVLALALLALVAKMVNDQFAVLSDQIEFNARLVDTLCDVKRAK